MELVFFKEKVQLLGWVGLLIYSENHHFVHVFQIGPDAVQRYFIVIEIIDHLLNVANVSIAPSTLVIPQTPERRNMTAPYIVMELLQERLRIFLPKKYQKLRVTSDTVETQGLRVEFRLDQHPMSVFKVY